MRINQATVDLVKKWEGYRGKAYRCPAGVWTIGFGTTSRAGIGVTVREGMQTTPAEAERWLREGLEKFAAEIRPGFTRPANDNQFGAFLSLAYNIGGPAFLRSSALRRWNEGRDDEVPAAFRLWVNAGGRFMQGLANRREDEIRLFLTPDRDAMAWDLAAAVALGVPDPPGPLARFTAAVARLFRRD